MLVVLSWLSRSMTLSRLLRISRHRVRSVARSDQLDAELRREVAFHFDQLVEEFAAEARESLERQAAVEAADRVTFDPFLANYFGT